MKGLTVFTPTYNRADLLPRLYQSLCSQTNPNFVWLIIDDGSTDETEALVKSWQQEKEIEIRYHYKENGGMHTGHNAAYGLIDTELNTCIDSDDWMPEHAVALILDTWASITDKDHYSGLVGLDIYESGGVVGSEIPDGIQQGSYYDLYKVSKGDKKFVLKTEAVKKYPAYPEYKGEKLVPLGILYIMMGEDKPFVFLNQPLCIVDYQAEGSSQTIFKQYKQSPLGFAYARKTGKTYTHSLFNKFKNSVHLVSSAIFARKPKLLFEPPCVFLNIIALPFGVLLNWYIRAKTTRG